MQRVNEYRFYELGKKVAALEKIESETTISDAFFPLWEARAALDKLCDDAVGLRVSLPAVKRAISAVTSILPEHFQDAIKLMRDSDGSPATTVGPHYWELRDAVSALEPVLSAECNALDTYVISKKRGYMTSDLVEKAEVMLPLETQNLMTPTVIEDVRSSGRCLAFDTPTACGFHILRATEAVMATYFKHVTGKDLRKQNRNWGLYLVRLGKEPQSDKKILGALSHIKDNYRNPISHPEVMLTEGEAIMLFGLCLSVIELMAELMRSTPPVLPIAEQAKALAAIAETEDGLDF